MWLWWHTATPPPVKSRNESPVRHKEGVAPTMFLQEEHQTSGASIAFLRMPVRKQEKKELQ